MSAPRTPYQDLPERAFWRPAVAGRHYFDLEDLARPVDIRPGDRIASAGSCFAQHIGRHLRRSGAHYLDLEPRPDFVPAAEAVRFGYDTYSCRYGNIYTSRQLLQLAQEALAGRQPAEGVWTRDGRHFDALRPSVDPVGHAAADDILDLRRHHIRRVAQMFRTLDVFVFTLGMTETWTSRLDGTAYPSAPGTTAGLYDPARHSFANLRYPEVRADLEAFIALLRRDNPGARLVLTVSPVPLKATASEDHVLVATARSKATLRAVAADLSEDVPGVFYFPAFEIISSHAGRGMFFEPDLRSVNQAGVALVMKHLAHSLGGGAAGIDSGQDDGILCDEDAIEEAGAAEPR